MYSFLLANEHGHAGTSFAMPVVAAEAARYLSMLAEFKAIRCSARTGPQIGAGIIQHEESFAAMRAGR
ncbi:hypothetical protein [Bradyrhizobium sp. CCGUVB23]|uniref:hypothetical protein n=1 Tax=Bradyrhizobium sp. CCGUVB23 TaxID=2949630 RepID=UPI0020B3F8DD|nr:hypothetical protein [Bradyrhizobium sp. CCGUVB23]MCP3460588.1 hypothetical protein [Bradyrhizobium sp. CCGUVB23]